MTDQIDDIDKLSYQLEQVQKLHADSLRELQETEGKLLDKSAYHAKRKVLTEAHEQASKIIQDRIGSTFQEQRRNLAMALRFEGNTEAERQAFAHACELVESAKTVPQQEEIISRALR